MEWTDDAIVLGTRRHGEASAVLELMTREHGRHLGMIKAARSPALAATLQPGNAVSATWRARLDEHLGQWLVEATRLVAASFMTNPLALHGIQHAAGLLRLLPERDPHPELYAALEVVTGQFDDAGLSGELMVRLEMAVLETLGFGLDLGVCALTGATDDLAWVSPRTGRAATRAAGSPYGNRLLPLPAFLVERRPHEAPDAGQLRDGFRLTGHFLARHVWDPRALAPPDARAGFLAALERRLAD
ncbi:MAG: DNA repair protein RecO [Hyphomicrobiaceae bacterium]|nr:DNA repair protein RecO [Hyphomicrobiaceae bacterium]